MLPSIGLAETLMLAMIALIVVGPKDLPLLARKLGRFFGQMRGLANEFRESFDELGRQAEIEEIEKEARRLGTLDQEIMSDLDIPEMTDDYFDAKESHSESESSLPADDADALPTKNNSEKSTSAADSKAEMNVGKKKVKKATKKKKS